LTAEKKLYDSNIGHNLDH